MISDFIPENRGVATMIEAQHTCCSNRGIGHNSIMKTMHMDGVFLADASIKQEFLFMIKD